MNHTYSKQGTSRRLERWGGTEHVVTVTESGVAQVTGGRFDCFPAVDGPNPPDAPSFTPGRQPEEGLVIEHYSEICGAARHDFEGENGSRQWSDESFAIHASLVDVGGRFRVGATFGGPDCALQYERWWAGLPGGEELREAPARPPRRLTLPPHVAAQIFPLLLGATPGTLDDPAVPAMRFVQRPPAWAAIDGCGRPVEAREIGSTEHGRLSRRAASSWFRPSYRFRPRLAPLHVALECTAATGGSDSDAVAISATGSPEVTARGLRIDLLCRGNGATFLQRLDLTFAEWLEAIESVGEDYVWTPLYTGAWGSTTILRFR